MLAPAFVVVVVAIVGTRVTSVTDDFLEGLRSVCCGIGCEQTCFWPFLNPFDSEMAEVAAAIIGCGWW